MRLCLLNTMVQEFRPPESKRERERVKGEVYCRLCSLPAGHPDCNRLKGQAVWNRLAEQFRRDPPNEWRGEKWGLVYRLKPPEDSYRCDPRLTFPKGEDANYHFVSNEGWEIHVRENDNTGYAYTVHFETSPSYSQLGHVGDIYTGQYKSMRKKHRLTWSDYEEPVPLKI